MDKEAKIIPDGKNFSPRGSRRGKLEATNWLEGISGSGDFDVVEVSFKNTRNGFYRNPDHLELNIGDVVAVEAAPGHDIGRVTMVGRLVALQMKKNNIPEQSELKKVFRIATQADMEKFEQARAREHDTMIRSRRIAEELELNMKIGDVEYQGDGAKAIFYYIADERVDFRKLIRILAETFKVRIEMKQIGARQEAGRIGGIGPCGRPLCCSTWMTHFVSVGTGAARMQDLSMNPQKLAGQCAKLKCCLNFEIDAYSEARHKLPPKDVTLETNDATYFYFKPDILAGTVTYSTDKGIPANLVTLPLRRIHEIIALNKQGLKVDSLLTEISETPEKEYVDLVGQDSLTRFDKSKKKKKRKQQNNQEPESGNDKLPKNPNQEKQPEPKKEKQPEPKKEKEVRNNRNRNNNHNHKKNNQRPKAEKMSNESDKNGNNNG